MNSTAPEQDLQDAWKLAFIDVVGSRVRAMHALVGAAESGESQAWSRWLLALADVNSLDLPSAKAQLYAARDWFVKNASSRGQAMCAELDAAMALQSGDVMRASLIHRALDGAIKEDQLAIDRFFAHYQRARFARALGQWEVAARHLDASWETAELGGNLGAVVAVRSQLGALKLEQGELEEAESHCAAALTLAQELNAIEAATNAAIPLIVIRDALGDFEGSRALAQSLQNESSPRAPGYLARAALPLALSCLRAGDLERADAWLEVSSGNAVSEGDNAVFWTWLSAQTLMHRDQHAPAINLCERVLSERGHNTRPFHLQQLLETLAAAHEHEGHTLRAKQCRELANGSRKGIHDTLVELNDTTTISADPQSGVRHCEPA